MSTKAQGMVMSWAQRQTGGHGSVSSISASPIIRTQIVDRRTPVVPMFCLALGMHLLAAEDPLEVERVPRLACSDEDVTIVRQSEHTAG
eukprot:CAMPEP_0204120614 /NCGR_PEP_ID=MMETSP0361-20130328/7752_1 /ASSEMBLY_ACC=CAM_ASM_000343 /TAXON_ID=268821 /ORGANISM="Scrippsiella Hangoei, Strain SHTV-5" /LENGTH=88 /DNA_ID=CAMNT_0051071841 /DNA_START=34 /DNA_END=297 /DNA_ORIENTATION=-